MSQKPLFRLTLREFDNYITPMNLSAKLLTDSVGILTPYSGIGNIRISLRALNEKHKKQIYESNSLI
jgi:hypothetical protein